MSMWDILYRFTVLYTPDIRTMSFTGNNDKRNLLIYVCDFFQCLLQRVNQLKGEVGWWFWTVCCHGDHNHTGIFPKMLHWVHSGCQVPFYWQTLVHSLQLQLITRYIHIGMNKGTIIHTLIFYAIALTAATMSETWRFLLLPVILPSVNLTTIRNWTIPAGWHLHAVVYSSVLHI